jgi:phage/conjugal plasmid C-4 type zinc finger protein, traR family
MDEADRAEALIEATTANALARIQAAQQQAGQADCADCGEPIPAARRVANPAAIRCIDCQEIYERRHRGKP